MKLDWERYEGKSGVEREGGLEVERERVFIGRGEGGWERGGVDSNGWMPGTTANVQKMFMRFLTVENSSTMNKYKK